MLYVHTRVGPAEGTGKAYEASSPWPLLIPLATPVKYTAQGKDQQRGTKLGR